MEPVPTAAKSVGCSLLILIPCSVVFTHEPLPERYAIRGLWPPPLEEWRGQRPWRCPPQWGQHGWGHPLCPRRSEHLQRLKKDETVAEKIDEFVIRKIPQTVRAESESASFTMSHWSSVVSSSPYEIYLFSVNTVECYFLATKHNSWEKSLKKEKKTDIVEIISRNLRNQYK